MALRKIVEMGDPCLSKVCRPVTAFNSRLHALLDDMAETLADANGAGLAAPQEGRLSGPGKWGIVPRPNVVRVRAQDRYGEWFEAEAQGLTARCFCHELEHLDGHLYTEHIDHFLSDEEVRAYLEAEEKGE